MKRTRSLSTFLASGVAVVALVSSCTIETKSSDGSGGSGTTGGTASTTGGSSATTGGSEATGGASATGGAATTGGASATGGAATTGGAASVAGSGGDGSGALGGSGGAGGDGAGDAGGQGGASYDDCDACIDARCTKEFDACLQDSVCISEEADGSGQYEQVVACVEMIRTTRPVKRADLRDCGNSVGSGLSTLWPPEEMTVATVDLINCMATGQTNESGNSAWANQSNITNPWAAGSCAKLACTSQLP
jgi:hypothetical protein